LQGICMNFSSGKGYDVLYF